jgi:hypothetical protein
MGSKSSAKNEMELAEVKKQSMFAALQNFMRWIPTSRKDIIASEQRLLTLIKSVTPSPSFLLLLLTSLPISLCIVAMYHPSIVFLSPLDCCCTANLGVNIFLLGFCIPATHNRTPYQQEQINIGSGPPGSKLRWFRSTSSEPRFINTITFEKNSGAAAEAEVVVEEEVPTLVLVHGYGASQGFFFRNFDALATKFRVLAIDQLG